MKRIISALALLTVAAVGAAGCGGDDDDSSNSSAGKGNTAGTSNSNGGDATTPGGGGDTTTPGGGGDTTTPGGGGEATGTGGAASGNVMCDPSLDGVCQNATDCPSVASGEARMSAGTCGQGCLGSKDAECASKCIVKDTGMTSDCATCYAGVVACATKNCLAQCIQDPASDECTACQVEKGCRSAFDECSGLTE